MRWPKDPQAWIVGRRETKERRGVSCIVWAYLLRIEGMFTEVDARIQMVGDGGKYSCRDVSKAVVLEGVDGCSRPVIRL